MRTAVAWVIALITACSFAPRSGGQEQQSVWARHTHQSTGDLWLDDVSLRGTRSEELGDPRLGRLALRERSRIDQMSEGDLIVWLRLVGVYHIHEAEGVLLDAAERLIGEPNAESNERGRVFTALAVVAGPGSEDRLRALMHAEIDEAEVFRQNAEESYRAAFAAALVVLDDDEGREHLIEKYKVYLASIDEPGRRRHFSARIALEAIYDAELIERVAALADDPAFQGRKQQNNIRGLVEVMRFNGAPIDVVRAAVDDSDHENMNRRIEAMHVLSERGTKEDIARLSDLRGWTNAPDLTPDHVHHDILEQERFRSMTLLACRLWRER